MSFWIRDMKTELGVTVLMVEHDMTLVNRVSNRVIALNYGRVLAMGIAGRGSGPSRRRCRLSRRLKMMA